MIKWLSIPSSDRCIKIRSKAHILNDIIKKQLKQFILRHIKVNVNLIGLLKCDEFVLIIKFLFTTIDLLQNINLITAS